MKQIFKVLFLSMILNFNFSKMELTKDTSEISLKQSTTSECDRNELNKLLIEVRNYLDSSKESEYPISSIENLKDALNYCSEIMIKEPCNQNEIDNAKSSLTTVYNSMKNYKGKYFEIPKNDGIYNIERGFIHPGGLYTEEDFKRIKRQLMEGNEKVTSAFNLLKNSNYAQPNAATYPVETIIRGGGVGENYINAARGATIAFQNALRWKIEGNLLCAQHAIEVLMAWASTTKKVSGNTNYALATSLYGYEFAQAAELMRDYEGWKKEDFEKFKQWMLNVWYPLCIKFLRERNSTWENKSKWWESPGHYWSNWGLCNVLAVISIGVLCDDIFIYNQGISFFKYDQVGTFEDPRTEIPIKNNGLTEFLGNLVVTTSKSELETGAYGKLGQMNESGRDIGHACMAVGLAIDIAHQGWNQGDDLFSYMDYRLAAGIEFVAAQTQIVNGLPWTDYIYGNNGFYYTDYRAYTMTAPALEKHIRPYWGTVIGHYEGIKGISMPYSKMAYNDMGIDGGGKGGASGFYDHLGYSVLLNTREGLASSNKKPTELKPKIKYKGDLNKLLPSIDVEKKMGNINEDIISHSELGGLINNYNINNNVGIPKGSNIILIPQLPEGEENTGIWKWNTGETTQIISVTADKSYAYRVTYTNVNGIESHQLFTLAVQGDCLQTKGTQSIYKDGIYIGSNIAEVDSGVSLTLELNVEDIFGTIIWSTGDSDFKINIPCLYSSRNITAVYTNQGGNHNIFTYQLNVVKK